MVKRLQIFLTVGSQMPFDRLTEAVAHWARQRPAVHIVAQIGASRLPPSALASIDCVPTLDPAAYDLACRRSQLIVAHAGMGSILTAIDLPRPLVILPRRGPLQETRNDHQFHTAWRLLQQQNPCVCDADAARPHPNVGDHLPPALQSVHVALDESQLPAVLDQVCVGLLAQLNSCSQLHPNPTPHLRSAASGRPSQAVEAGAMRSPAPTAPHSMPRRTALVDHLRSLIASVRAG